MQGGASASTRSPATCATREDARRLVAACSSVMGALDLLVNNAGGQFFSPAELIAAKGWRAVWRLNVEGMLNMAEAAFELALAPARAGTIVNVTLSPHHGMPGMAHSGAARAAVEALTRELAQRWAADGVTVAAVAAGHFRHRGDGQVPGERARRHVALGAAAAARATAPSTPGSSRCSPRRWAGVQRVDRDARRGARQLVRAMAAAGAGRRGRRGAGGGAAVGAGRRVAVVPAAPAVRWAMALRAKCCGCTKAFQAFRAGSIPVARLSATGSGAVW